MLTELNCTNKVAGAKQVKRALNDDRVLKLFVAGNADPRVTQPLAQQAVVFADLAIEIGPQIQVGEGVLRAAEPGAFVDLLNPRPIRQGGLLKK